MAAAGEAYVPGILLPAACDACSICIQHAAGVWMCGVAPILCSSARGSHVRARLASDDTECGFVQLGQEGGRYIACSVPSLLLDPFFLSRSIS